MRITVIVDDRAPQDDTTDRDYHVIKLRQDGAVFVPVEHRWAQQGRGVIGWTTGPTT
jgi:hypothetical protein